MAYDKVVDSAALDASFTAIADAIREKRGITASLTPEQMPAEIRNILGAIIPMIDVEATDTPRNLVQVDGFNLQEIAFELLPPPVKYACFAASDTTFTGKIGSMLDADGYLYYRITTTDFRRAGTTKTFSTFGEFALYDAEGTNVARSSGAEYTASSYYSDANAPSKAFDGDPTTVWHSDWKNAISSTHWLQVKLPQKATISRMGLTPRYDSTSYKDYPYDFALSASNDGETWVEVDSWSGVSDGWSLGVERLFDLYTVPISVGDWVLATVMTYHAATYPTDWTLLHETSVLDSESVDHHLAFLCKQADSTEMEITVEQETAGEIRLNIIAVSDVSGFAYHDGTEYTASGAQSGISGSFNPQIVKRPNCSVLIWGCSATHWASGNWSGNDIRHSVITGDATALANFWDDTIAEYRAFTAKNSGTGGVIIDCVEVLTE